MMRVMELVVATRSSTAVVVDIVSLDRFVVSGWKGSDDHWACGRIQVI
jgi:hypothetical protein